MNKGKHKLLLLALLFSTFSMPAHAITSSALDGTLLFNNKQNWGHRIYHAFDLPYTSQTSIGPTFPSETITAPISGNLAAIASRGYTHIQISPPHLTTPSISSTVTQDGNTPTVISHNPKTNGWEFSYQPLLCVLDDAYQAELDAVFGTGIKIVSQYGVTINGKVVGYRLGSDRYGSLKDLKDLIDAANRNGLKIIADAVFNQTSGYMTNQPGDSSPQFHPYTYVSARGSEKATYTWDKTVDLTTFFHPRNSMDPWYAPSSWVYGPDLNVEYSMVQQMIVGYMQLLSDIGICGIRFDLLYGLGPSATKTILEQANATGMFQDAPFGYGENDQSFQDLESYGAIVPVQDHPLHYSLANCLVVGLPVSTLVAPKALGNITTATFSVNHDQYPGVSTGTGSLTGFYSKSQSPEDVIDRTTSQLAIAYLCAKRDGNPHILRFEDERDSKTLIQRSLAFRVLMEQQNAPHEYIAALPYTHDVLLIARQYGFVIINRNPTYDYKITKDVIKNSGIPSAYLPDGEYNELLSLGTGGTDTTQYTLSSSGFSKGLAVGPMDAKFLVLKNTTGQNAYDVTFKASCSTTVTGDLVFIVGNHPLLGNWGARPDSLNGLLCQKSYPTPANSGVTWPNWTSLPLRFPVGMSLQYKFAVANTQANNGSIKKWESGVNRTYAVTDDVTVSASPPANWPN